MNHETIVHEISCMAHSLSFATDENNYVRGIDRLVIINITLLSIYPDKLLRG